MGLLTVSCNKHNNSERKWVGTYHYIVNVVSSGPESGSRRDTIYYGDIQVSRIKGQEGVFMALLPDSARTWQCAVDEDGRLTLLSSNQWYVYFQGRFIVPDSLDFVCSIASPGAGAEWHYRCQR